MFPDSPLHSATTFQLSPDFRPRASSNASSCGRLSPIPYSESEWSSPTSYPSGEFFSHPSRASGSTDRPDCPPVAGYVSEQLAGNLAEGVKLHHDAFLTGAYTNNGGAPPPPPPPPPYHPTFENFSSRIGHAASPYGISQCPVHRLQGCSCALSQCAREVRPPGPVRFSHGSPNDPLLQSMSPAGLSPTYPQNEPSSDAMTPSQTPFVRRNSITSSRIHRNNPSTMMGQLMGALNDSTVLDDLTLNIESFQGGFNCNVDEVIKHELSMDGSLDFNFSHNQVCDRRESTPQPPSRVTETFPCLQTSLSTGPTVSDSNSSQNANNYSTTVSATGHSWVH